MHKNRMNRLKLEKPVSMPTDLKENGLLAGKNIITKTILQLTEAFLLALGLK